jgi:hypothetical protein
MPNPLIATVVDQGGQVYNVKAYGAVGDGVVNDTVAIQSACTAALAVGGKVYIPAGTYRLTSTLNLGDGTPGTKLYLEGAGPNATFLNWYGSTSGIAVQINRLKYYKISGIGVSNNAAGVGTTVGILSDSPTGGGMQSGQCLWEHVSVGGFNTGIQFGGTTATSEVLCNHLKVSTCTTGILLQTGNTLNYTFNMLLMSGNTDGLKTLGNAGQVNVTGGSASLNTNADFNLAGAALTTIIGFRSEGTNRFLVGGAAIDVATTLIGCLVHASSNVDGVLIDWNPGGAPLNIFGGLYCGKIKYGGSAYQSGLMNMQGVGVADTTPFVVTATYDVRYVSFGNTRVDANGFFLNRFPDEIGIATNAGRLPVFKFGSYPTGATNVAELRSMYGVSGTTTKANNLRGSSVFATAATRVVTFGTAEVQSLAASGATTGTVSLVFNGYTSAAINWNATAAQVQAALVALLSIGAGGVSCAGGPLNTGAITITFAGPLVGGGPQNLITISSNTIDVAPVITRSSAGTGNPPEPDASYFVSLSGNASETFFVTGKATSGFTLNSSNVTSTATVDWHLIR